MERARKGQTPPGNAPKSKQGRAQERDRNDCTDKGLPEAENPPWKLPAHPDLNKRGRSV
jgi:hypothetical protein